MVLQPYTPHPSPPRVRVVPPPTLGGWGRAGWERCRGGYFTLPHHPPTPPSRVESGVRGRNGGRDGRHVGPSYSVSSSPRTLRRASYLPRVEDLGNPEEPKGCRQPRPPVLSTSVSVGPPPPVWRRPEVSWVGGSSVPPAFRTRPFLLRPGHSRAQPLTCFCTVDNTRRGRSRHSSRPKSRGPHYSGLVCRRRSHSHCEPVLRVRVDFG